ncbi:MAG: response regulator [Defluviitaleaceae bacterium]|nr:response regulator [Defluviitaleaceae bacterium]
MKRSVEDEKHLLDESVNWENIRIFAVDDEPEIREFFTLVAENLKIACTVAESGEEALMLLEKDNRHNIFFIDWKLNGMNGVELVKNIRSKSTEKSVVIVFSSVDWSIIENEAKDAGVDKFLPKPLFPSVIVDAINTYISRRFGSGPDESGVYTDDFGGHTILLADDVEINREIVLSLLEPTKLAVDCAENGVRAVELFRENPDKYGMIFMDIQMPEMDGFEATRNIRALGCAHAKAVPIIAMTANVFREDIAKCLEVGMNGHIGKPIDLNEVMNELRRYLHQR